MEQHHQVQILDEALEAAVRLTTATSRRAMPDKSVSLLIPCARVAVSCMRRRPRSTTAASASRRWRPSGIIGREKAIGVDVGKRQDDANELLTAERTRLTSWTHAGPKSARWSTNY